MGGPPVHVNWTAPVQQANLPVWDDSKAETHLRQAIHKNKL